MKLDWFWLCCIKGLSLKEKRMLLQYFKNPKAIRQASEKEIREADFLKEKTQERILDHQRNFQLEKVYHKYREMGIKFISLEDREYPQRLREIQDCPWGLFVKGRLPDQEEKCVAVVGARMCSNYGRSMARELAVRLAENGVSVVSGLALGVDGAAQGACLEAGGKSYGVLGCGPDICYPPEHRRLYLEVEKRGGILSEFPAGTSPFPYNFPMRNRIISGLCQVVAVVEAKKKSGSLITADLALEQGRDVYAFPGRMGDPLSEGCNGLISQGAGIITDFQELLEAIGVKAGNVKKNVKSNMVLASSENMVYSCLDSRSKSLQSICEEVSIPVTQVMSALSGLLIKDLIEETARNYYVKKR